MKISAQEEEEQEEQVKEEQIQEIKSEKKLSATSKYDFVPGESLNSEGKASNRRVELLKL